jgi:hypothetical protein
LPACQLSTAPATAWHHLQQQQQQQQQHHHKDKHVRIIIDQY